MDLHPTFKEAAKREGVQIKIRMEIGELKEVVKANGSPQLSFLHPTDLVVRKSDYVCPRTTAIKANKAAIDISREIIEKLRDPHQRVKITLTVKGFSEFRHPQPPAK